MVTVGGCQVSREVGLGRLWNRHVNMDEGGLTVKIYFCGTNICINELGVKK